MKTESHSFTDWSRYGSWRKVVRISSSRGRVLFSVHGPCETCRFGPRMFDFEGGPFLQVGADFYGLGRIIEVYPTESVQEGEEFFNACHVAIFENENKNWFHKVSCILHGWFFSFMRHSLKKGRRCL